MKVRILLSSLVAVLLLSSCSLTKYVPEDKYLLNKVHIKSDVDGIGKEDLEPFLRQKPNPGIFGAYRLQLKVYNLSGRDTTKWINRMWRRIGEPPVIYSEGYTERTKDEMRKYLHNKGYVNAEVSADVSLKRKKANLTYRIKGNTPYHIRKISYSIEDDSIRSFILDDTLDAVLTEGTLFDVDKMEADRQRMVTLLRREGFYYFNKDYLFIEADSTVGKNQVDITFKSRPMLQSKQDGTIERLPHKRMKVRTVSFVPWYNPDKKVIEQIDDTVFYGGYIFFYKKPVQLKPAILAEKTYIIPNTYYDERDVERTYAALSSLSTSRYVNIMFREREDGMLDCFILMSPSKVQTFTVEVEGNNTDGDIGAAVSGSYIHRNLFKGAEQLNLKARTAYQPMGEISNLLSNNAIDIGGEASINFPKFMFPLLSRDIRQRVRASTELSFSYNYQTNPWYARTIAGSGVKYMWATGMNNGERYTVDLVDISYVYLPRISESFKDTYLNTTSIIRYSYEDHFIMSTGFSFSKNTKNPNRNSGSSYSYRGSVETGGNLLSAICSLTNVEKVDGAYQLGNIRFAQYAKGEFDFAQNNTIDYRNKLVYRLHFGIAYPYGNADVVPFEKRFFAGGANSVRGWSVRSLGPGVYRSTTSGTDFMQTGDIKLDLNLEYRFKLFWVLEGAAFMDGGNVWTINEYQTQQGGLFELNSFYKQIAYAYGCGLRFDFSFFLFRVDMGVKLYDPTLSSEYQWRYPIKNSDLAFHFAIGYPF